MALFYDAVAGVPQDVLEEDPDGVGKTIQFRNPLRFERVEAEDGGGAVSEIEAGAGVKWVVWHGSKITGATGGPGGTGGTGIDHCLPCPQRPVTKSIHSEAKLIDSEAKTAHFEAEAAYSGPITAYSVPESVDFAMGKVDFVAELATWASEAASCVAKLAYFVAEMA